MTPYGFDCFPLASSSLLLLSNAVTKAFGSRHPYVITLEIDAQDVVMRRRRVHLDLAGFSGGVPHQHLRFAGVEIGPIHRPIGAVVVGQALVGAKPGSVGIDALNEIQKIAR
jgi:hypothetical protein